jgi:hypothetical protein
VLNFTWWVNRKDAGSMVGLVPLFAAEFLEDDAVGRLPGFRRRMEWFLRNRRDLARQIAYVDRRGEGGGHGHRLLAIPSRERLERVLRYLVDEGEFLSAFGVRSPRSSTRRTRTSSTRTGRSTTCWWRPSSATTTSTRTTCGSSVPPAPVVS